MKRLADLGFNFYSIYAHHLPSFMLHDPGLEATFAINDAYDVTLVEATAHFGFTALEASIVPGEEYGSPLSFADVLHYRQLVLKAGVPVLVPSQRKLVSEDVPVLHHSGIKAIMLGAIVTGKTEDQLRIAVSSFRNAIDRLGQRDLRDRNSLFLNRWLLAILAQNHLLLDIWTLLILRNFLLILWNIRTDRVQGGTGREPL